MSLHTLQRYRDAGAVTRFHAKRTLRSQSVAEHTFGMLMLIRQVWPCVDADVYNAILHHDLPELDTGDVPGPAKRAHPALKSALDAVEAASGLQYPHRIPAWVAAMIQWADALECVLWCLEEVRLGNTFFRSTAAAMLGVVCANGVPVEARKLTDAVIDDAFSLGIPVTR